MKNRILLVIPLIAIVAGLVYWLLPSGYCDSAYDEYGLKVPVCPDGKIRQVASVEGRNLKRGGDGTIEVALYARYTTHQADEALTVIVEHFDTELFLVDSSKKETKLQVKEKWKELESTKVATVVLPKVHDGDYWLRSKITSRIGVETVDMKLALYSPAKIHLLTDRPIYEPGNTIQFRALVLRATDLSPIDNRSGVWIVRNPSGEILLEEKAPAGEWGIVAGDFPLSHDAEEGRWTVSWRSGDDESSTSFNVEPFVLPRFRVDSKSEKKYYQAGESPVLSGAVVYASGAPVAGAKLEISWSATGQWPPPSEWIAGGLLPKQALAADNGRFEISLPEVPQDLRGQSTLRANISAIDPAGDRVEASASILLSEDSILVSAVTEFDDALVENTNNRVYLRVTTPTGTPLGGASINVKRAWAPGDSGIDAELDSEGVTRIQFDPGRPINVVIPPMPMRAPVRAQAGSSSLSGLQDLVSGQQAPLSDMIAAESWLRGINDCSHWVRSSSQSVSLAFRVDKKGNLSAVTTSKEPLNECIADSIRKNRMPAGNDRLYSANFSIQASKLPILDASLSSSMSTPDELPSKINRAATNARQCATKNFEGALPWMLFWRTSAGSNKVVLSWMKETGAGKPMPAGLERCLMSSLQSLSLDKVSETSSIGLIRYTLTQPDAKPSQTKAQPTILQGYELTVSATVGEKELGQTTLRMLPGSVPVLRLRATPVLATQGDEIELAFFRGPNYQGDLPSEIDLAHEGAYFEIELPKKAKGGTYKLPEDAKGWYEFSAGGARALVFVRPDNQLALTLSTENTSYLPGQMAKIQVHTTVAGSGAKAAVGLFGVDNSLAQIATLRGPDDLGNVRPTVTMQRKAFNTLDAQALSMGRIGGAYAAEATVLRVQSVPPPGAMDSVLYTSVETEFAPISELTDLFYIALAELHLQTRSWESSAAEGVVMTPKQMANLWNQALQACGKKGHAIVDPYGRALRLHWLPPDLLDLVSPAMVVADATRLAEDVENWHQWVMKEQP